MLRVRVCVCVCMCEMGMEIVTLFVGPLGRGGLNRSASNNGLGGT